MTHKSHIEENGLTSTEEKMRLIFNEFRMRFIYNNNGDLIPQPQVKLRFIYRAIGTALCSYQDKLWDKSTIIRFKDNLIYNKLIEQYGIMCVVNSEAVLMKLRTYNLKVAEHKGKITHNYYVEAININPYATNTIKEELTEE